MSETPSIRVVGRGRRLSPAESLVRAQALQEFAESRSRFPRPRGFVFKARTREEYEGWRRIQVNPRLW